MSLRIDVDKVDQVLLSDGWHKVDGRSFSLDAYEFVDQNETVFTGGQDDRISSTGAQWNEPDGTKIACPLNSVTAVKLVK
jgi:hypothetical protein